MKTLHLTLKKKWFDMILSGEKKEEYREIKDYWVNRLTQSEKEFPNEAERLLSGRQENVLCKDKSGIDIMPKYCFPEHFDTITFKNGYAADAPEMVVELKSIEITYLKHCKLRLNSYIYTSCHSQIR